jgi:glycosyltransferase involved in cell wall biosynthesis
MFIAMEGKGLYRMSVVALVAAFNEAHTIGDVVRQVRSHVDHVVVVDDGSTVARRIVHSRPAPGARHASNLGRSAIRTGLDLVLNRPHTMLFLDGDLQHEPDDAPALIAAAQRGDGDPCSVNALRFPHHAQVPLLHELHQQLGHFRVFIGQWVGFAPAFARGQQRRKAASDRQAMRSRLKC